MPEPRPGPGQRGIYKILENVWSQDLDQDLYKELYKDLDQDIFQDLGQDLDQDQAKDMNQESRLYISKDIKGQDGFCFF